MAWIGEITLFPYARTPQGYLPCEGQLLRIDGNHALYSLLGTNFGGDGRTNFGLPDLRNRLPAQQGQAEAGGHAGPGVKYYIAIEGDYPRL